ncbi:hypothetical protein EDD86DRAFT_248772 [Gorgonomyces haynaldii]|nr:hypothetical protein EDD86DRAFT_248772 [Gorgonomyces haynaldii]
MYCHFVSKQLLCDKCINMQTMVLHMLLDVDHEEEREEVEARYPLLCGNCRPRVKHEMEQIYKRYPKSIQQVSRKKRDYGVYWNIGHLILLFRAFYRDIWNHCLILVVLVGLVARGWHQYHLERERSILLHPPRLKFILKTLLSLMLLLAAYLLPYVYDHWLWSVLMVVQLLYISFGHMTLSQPDGRDPVPARSPQSERMPAHGQQTHRLETETQEPRITQRTQTHGLQTNRIQITERLDKVKPMQMRMDVDPSLRNTGLEDLLSKTNLSDKKSWW